MLIVRSDLSHTVVVEPSNAPVLVGVNVADHEIIVVAAVLYVVLLVEYPSEPSLSVNVVAATPEQVPFSYRLNTTVPAGAGAPDPVVIVASSCGSHLWVVESAVVSFTLKHSRVESV